MSTALGVKGIMGVGKQTLFRTAVNATDKILFLSENVELQNENLMHEYLYGGAATPGMQTVFEPIGGSVETVIPYTEKNGTQFVSTSLLIALAMGDCTWDAVNSMNQITFVDDLDVFATAAFDKGMSATDTWEYIGVMVSSLTISGNSGEFITASAELAGTQFVYSGTENTPTELQALPEDLPTLLMFSDLTFRLGNQAGALASTDETGISSFTLTINNNLSDAQQATPDDTNAFDYDHTDSKEPLKPVRNGFREVTFEITLPRYEADTLLDFWSNETPLQADLKFASGTNQFNIYLPHIKIEHISAPVQGAEAIEQVVTFRCLKANSATDVTFTDSAAIAGELGIETKDERTAAIF